MRYTIYLLCVTGATLLALTGYTRHLRQCYHKTLGH